MAPKSILKKTTSLKPISPRSIGRKKTEDILESGSEDEIDSDYEFESELETESEPEQEPKRVFPLVIHKPTKQHHFRGKPKDLEYSQPKSKSKSLIVYRTKTFPERECVNDYIISKNGVKRKKAETLIKIKFRDQYTLLNKVLGF